MEYYSGTLRISNPNTLQKWIDNGDYQLMINKGLVFNPSCGRFTQTKCECRKCRKKTNIELIKIIKNAKKI